MNKFYANERSILILIALLKAHNIKKIIASPGTTNLSFVASVQCDPFFEVYSCVDERSAAYMACGMAAETSEPVVITCTGATASRNYPSGLTEAYYRKLPILAITGTQDEYRIGHLHSQVIDRSVIPKDVVKYSTHIRATETPADEFYNQVKINTAINELFRDGGGPVHINLHTLYTRDFSIKTLPHVKVIHRYGYSEIEQFPDLPQGRIAIFVGSHNTFTTELTDAVDKFCAAHDAVVFCDNTSGYYGKYRVNFALLGSQENKTYSSINALDLCIHIGEVSAEYASLGKLLRKEVWRVSPDGEIRDQFQKLTALFYMNETDFFHYYTPEKVEERHTYLNLCLEEDQKLRTKLPEIPFSNVWIAGQLYDKIPNGSAIHFGVLNSIRSWNMFPLSKGVTSFANVGGFGIDGGVSSMIGASIARPDKLFFGVFGDLAFFYDMNSIGNRHVGNNVRILIVNNGRGQEFRNHYHTGHLFGDEADKYIAAAGHFGNQSHTLLRDYAINLGFKYLAASTKEEFECIKEEFVASGIGTQPILLECFTNTEDECNATSAYWSTDKDVKNFAINKVINAFGGKQMVRNFIGARGVKFFRALLNKKD